jgi:hypothetical protein
MPDRPLATLCLGTSGECSPAFLHCLDSLLENPLAEDVELRVGLPQASPALHYALGRFRCDDPPLEYARLPGDIERFRGRASCGQPVCCWCFPRPLPGEAMLRWLWCDLSLTTEYVVWLGETVPLADSWWQALLSAPHPEADVSGPWVWSDFPLADGEILRAQPWYRGVPLLRREGRSGVWTPQGGPLAFRVACLHQADLFTTWLPRGGGEACERVFFWLGAMAHQLGWRQAVPPESGQGESDAGMPGVA